MTIGIPKEIKNHESRVSLTPSGVVELIKHNHQVFIEKNAGINSGFTDEQYIKAGATIVDSAQKVWMQEMVIKVKEPLTSEYKYLRQGLILFTFLHLAANLELTQQLLEKEVTALAYETIEVDRELPILKPMSEIAGRRSILFGAMLLEKINNGSGILMSSVPGVEKTNVVVVGGGVAGLNAAQMAIGLNTNVTVLEINEHRIRYLDQILGSRATILKSNYDNLEKMTKKADLLISTILLPGAKAPKIITEDMVKQMKPRSVIIDIAIDQGGSVETIDQVTSHDQPTFEKYNVIHSSVANIPGAVPKTSTLALTNATLQYILKIANNGLELALNKFIDLRKGVNCYGGHLVSKEVADSLALNYAELSIAKN